MPTLAESIRPTLAEVAVLLVARTTDKSTGVKGSWTSNTHPSSTQVTATVDQAVNETLGRWPALPASLAPTGKLVTLYRAAVLIEESYFPESAQSGDGSLYEQYVAVWDRYSRELTAMYSKRTPRSRIGSVRLQSRSDEWREQNELDQSTDDWNPDNWTP